MGIHVIMMMEMEHTFADAKYVETENGLQRGSVMSLSYNYRGYYLNGLKDACWQFIMEHV